MHISTPTTGQSPTQNTRQITRLGHQNGHAYNLEGPQAAPVDCFYEPHSAVRQYTLPGPTRAEAFVQPQRIGPFLIQGHPQPVCPTCQSPVLQAPDYMAMPQAQVYADQQQPPSRHELFALMRQMPLVATAYGRSVLSLSEYHWFRLANGINYMMLSAEDNAMRVVELSERLNALQLGIKAHRSITYKILAVENINLLNFLLVQNHCTPIMVVRQDLPRFIRTNRMPGFCRDNFVTQGPRRHQPGF